MHNNLRHLIWFGLAFALNLVTSLLPMLATAEANRWTAIGPDGANVVALIVDPRTPATAFAGTLGSGVLKTTDGGTTWASANGALPTVNVSALVLDRATPSTVYAGTDVGAFKSHDGGQSWIAVNAGLDGAPQINALAISSGSPSTIYAGTWSGVFKSTDGAASWVSANAGLSGLSARIIAIDPSLPSTLYIGVDDDSDDCSRCGMFKSTDGGTTWSRVSTLPNAGHWPNVYVAAIAIDPSASSHVYVCLASGIVESTDGGANWSGIAAPSDNPASLVVDPVSPGTLYASNYNGVIFRTTDAGGHWLRVSVGPLVWAGIIALAPSAPSTIYVGDSTGIYRTSDNAQTWTRLTLGIRNIGAYTVTSDPVSSPTIYSSLNGVVTKTTDGGAHWANLADGPPLGWVGFITFDPASPSTIYVGGRSISDEDGAAPLYKSIDGGAHWLSPATGLSSRPIEALAISPSRSSTLYAGVNSSGVLKSIDGGTSWVKVNNGLTAVGIYVSALAVDPTNADTVYVATPPTGRPDTDAKLFKSTNGAAQWHQLPFTVPAGAVIRALAIDPATPSTIYAAYAYGNASEGGVYRSVDGGETWTAAHSGMSDTTWVVALVIDQSAPNRIYAATQNGVYMSTDVAANWTLINSGPTDLDVWAISIDRTGSLLRAATPAGLFEYQLSGATVPLIEYLHGVFRHYFITSIPDEISKLDNGTFAGWARTGSQFKAYAGPTAAASPVCRFFSTAYAPKSSHFYTPFPHECAIAKTDPHWSLESAAAFYIALPASDGSCAAGLKPVYRLYNDGQGGAPNHRYTTDLTIRAQMIAQGWIQEGVGTNAAQMCSPI